jgi:cytochrome c biogenesis factor
MFDLDWHIQSWRKEAAGPLAATPELLDELEAHLRDEFDRLTAVGESAEHAWACAMRKLGDPRPLAGEFAKLQTGFWLPARLAGVALALVVLLVTGLVVVRLAAGRAGPLLGVHVVLITAGYASLFATGFLGVCAVVARAATGWSERRDAAFRAQGTWLARIAAIATLLGVALGACWAHRYLGRWWAWDPRETGGLCVLAWAFVLLQSFRSADSTPQSRMCFAISGNMVVALSWFGPVQLSGGPHHSYGSPSADMFMGLFLVAHILVIYLALLPPGVLRHQHKKSRNRGSSSV